MLTRKQFLKTVSIASGTALLGFKAIDQLQAPSSGPGFLTFDLHCHPGRLFSEDFGGEPMDRGKTLSDMKAVQLSGAFFTLVADSKLIKLCPTGVEITGKYKPSEGWEEYKRQLKGMKDFFRAFSVRQAYRATDLKQSGSLAAYMAVEGGDFLEGSVEKLDEVYTDGIRAIQLVHYVPNDLGDLQTSAIMHNGLSPFGKEVVRKMNKLGLLIDMAHASFQTTKDAANLSDSPIMLSHSILEMEPDRPIAKRAISKEHAKVIAGTGGLIGLWPSGFNKSFDEFVDNSLRLIDVVGINHVGMGTDMDGNFKPVLNSYTQYPAFADALKNKGLSPKEVEKIMGTNAATLLKKVIKDK